MSTRRASSRVRMTFAASCGRSRVFLENRKPQYRDLAQFVLGSWMTGDPQLNYEPRVRVGSEPPITRLPTTLRDPQMISTHTSERLGADLRSCVALRLA